MDKTKLIELVKTHKCLYDPSDMHFYNIKCKSKIWQSIGKEMGEEDISCRSAWSALKFTYIRGIQKQEHKFPYSDEMSFLLPTIKDKTIKLSKKQLPGTSISGECDDSPSTNRRSKKKIDKNRSKYIKLIELVKRNPVLYDPSNEYFNNKGNIQNLTWDMVADEMNLPSEECINLWNQLKKNYKEAIRSSLNSRRFTRAAIFPYLKEFEFFKPHLSVRSQKRKSAYPNPMMDFFLAMANMVKNLPENEQTAVEQEISNMVLEAEKKYSSNNSNKETMDEDHADQEDDEIINSDVSADNSVSQEIIYSDDNSISIEYDGFLRTVKTDSTDEMTTVDELTDSSVSFSNTNESVSTAVKIKEEKLDVINDNRTIIKKGFIIKELPDEYDENCLKPIIKAENYDEEHESKPVINFFSNIPTQVKNEFHVSNLVEHATDLNIKSEPIAGPSTAYISDQNDIKIKTANYTDVASDGFSNNFQ